MNEQHTTMAGPTLHEALAARGLTSRKERDPQRRTVYTLAGERVGSFDAHEAWAYLRQLDQAA